MRRLWPFRIVAVCVGLALCYLASTLALAAAERRKHPVMALKLAPFDAQALANAAFMPLEADRSPATLARSRAMALRALAREPINVPALRTLGLIATMQGDNDAAKARFGLVERLSRRDLVTQLWWIEYEVSRNSVTGALSYFDEALRTSPRSIDILMPVLAAAAKEAPIVAALKPFLAQRPSYFRQFFIQAADSTPDIGQVSTLGMALLNRQNPDDQDLINRIISRFGRDDRYDDAWRVFLWASRARPSHYVVNGDFDHPTPFSLFNWDLADRDTVSAEVAQRDGSNSLYLVARVGQGLATRQLLRLPAGRYQLTATVGDTPEALIDRPTIDIACAKSNQPIMVPMKFPPSPTPTVPLKATFTAGPNCRYQWLVLRASASSEDETRAWIDDISIRPVRINQ